MNSLVNKITEKTRSYIKPRSSIAEAMEKASKEGVDTFRKNVEEDLERLAWTERVPLFTYNFIETKKQDMEKQIFKVGDRVYDINSGWGKVISVRSDLYPIRVDFASHSESYSKDGKYCMTMKATLSFTEYALEGFSQEREHEFKDGDLVWVRDNDLQMWQVRFLKTVKQTQFQFVCYDNQDKSSDTSCWKYCLPFEDNPLLNK